MRRFPLLGGETRPATSAATDARPDFDLNRTAGFLVADSRGRLVGKVEGPMYGTSQTTPDALSVRFSLLRWRRRLVPASAIAAIDDRTKVIGLAVDRDSIRPFL
jgi:hypothetical protein